MRNISCKTMRECIPGNVLTLVRYLSPLSLYRCHPYGCICERTPEKKHLNVKYAIKSSHKAITYAITSWFTLVISLSLVRSVGFRLKLFFPMESILIVYCPLLSAVTGMLYLHNTTALFSNYILNINCFRYLEIVFTLKMDTLLCLRCCGRNKHAICR